MSHTLQSISSELQNRLKDWAMQVSTSKDTSSIAHKLKMQTMLTLLTKFIGQSIPFATRNGFKVIDFKPGYVKALIPLKGNKNHFNAMYAGALFTVAELPGGIISILSFDDRFFPILKDLKMDFLKVAKSDVTVAFSLSQSELKRIEAEATKHGKCDFVLEGEIKDKDGEIVAKSFANYQVRAK